VYDFRERRRLKKARDGTKIFGVSLIGMVGVVGLGLTGISGRCVLRLTGVWCWFFGVFGYFGWVKRTGFKGFANFRLRFRTLEWNRGILGDGNVMVGAKIWSFGGWNIGFGV